MASIKIIAMIVVLCACVSLSFAQYPWGESGIPVLEDQDLSCWRENIVKNDRGDIFMAWRDSRGDYPATFLQKFNSQGQPYWTEDLRLPIYPYGGIIMCPTSDDGLIFTWAVEWDVSHALIKALKIDAEGNFLWPLPGIPVGRFICEGGGDRHTRSGTYTNQNLVADTAGGVFVLWGDDRENEFFLMAKHLLADGSTQPGWEHEGHPIHAYVLFLDNRYRVCSCPDGEGGFIVSWYQAWEDHGTYTQRVDGNGNLLWGPNGLTLSATGTLEAVVCPDGVGGAYYIWEDGRFTNHPMYMQRVSHEGNVLWQSGGLQIGQIGISENNPHIVPDGYGGVLASWEIGGYNATDIHAQRLSGTGQKLWTESGVAVTSAAGDQRYSSISSDGAGGLFALWSSWITYPNLDLYAQYITAAGNPAWAINGMPLRTGSDKTVSSLRVHCTDDGAALFFWFEHRNTREGLYMQKITTSGQLLFDPAGTPIRQGISGGGDNYTMTAISPDRFLFTWTDTRNYYPGRLIYYQMCDDRGNMVLVPSGRPICSDIDDYQNYSCAAATSDGGAVIAWRDWRNGVVNGQVYAQKIDANGNRLWHAMAVHVTSGNQGHQTNPYVCSDGAGGAYITWEYGSNIFIQRLAMDGRRLFGESATNITNSPEAEETKALFTDGENGAIVVYGVSQEWPLYAAKRILPTGATAWTDTIYYLPYNLGPGIEVIPAHGGGGLVVWEDHRSSMVADIYAQKFNNYGQNIWTANGVPVITSPSVEHSPSLAEDADGNVYFTWTKSYGDIYCQRFSPEGLPQFVPEGLIVCDAAGEQQEPGVVSDGLGGAIFHWQDKREYPYKPYALQLNAQGQIANPSWGVNGNPIHSFDSSNYGIWGGISDEAGGALYGWLDTRGFCVQRINDEVLSDLQKKAITGNRISIINFPNPFNPTTTLSYKLQVSSHISLKVYDTIGRLVATLVDGWKDLGYYEVRFDGSMLASGIYLYTFTTGELKTTGKLVLLK